MKQPSAATVAVRMCRWLWISIDVSPALAAPHPFQTKLCNMSVVRISEILHPAEQVKQSWHVLDYLIVL